MLKNIFMSFSFAQTKVMQNQLVLFHNACCAYHTADAAKLAECLQRFHIKLPAGERAGAAAPKETVKFTLLPVTAEEANSTASPSGSTPRY